MSKNKYTLITLISLAVVTLAFGQWGPDVRLTNDTFVSFLIYNNAWSVASSGNNVHVVWRDTRDGNYEVYYKRSLDNGTTWGTDTRITTDLAYSKNPCIAVSDSNIHVVWTDSRDGNDEIYYKHSLDNGTTWGPDTRLTTNSCTSLYPSLAVFDTNVHVVWYEDRGGSNYEIYYRHSLDNGITWSLDTSLSNATGWSGMPSIAVSGSNIHVAWRDGRDGNNEIYYRRSWDNGATWSADTNLTNNTSTSENACVAVSGSNVHVMFNDNRDGNHEIYYKRSLDNGATWGADTRLTDYLLTSTRPSVAVSDTNVHVGWFEYRDGNEEIYYKRSLDNGTSWSADTNLTNNSEYQGIPSIAVSGSDVHVVWMDERDGNEEIYYKRYLGTTTTSYTITATASAGGSITPSGDVIVEEGSDTTFTITPDLGYHLDSLMVDGISHGPDSTSYTFEDVTDDHTIDAYFSINTYTIIATTTSGGTITPFGSVIVEYDADTTFTITPDLGYHLDNLMVDGISHGPDSTSYVFEDVTTDHTIDAYFSSTALPGWAQKESIITPQVNKIIKDGGALVAVGSNLYAFLGSKTNRFKMYTIGSKSGWTDSDSIPFGYKFPLANPPVPHKKFIGKGAALCYDGDNIIYATRGNGTYQFWAYDMSTHIWTAKAFVPSTKPLKGGTSIRWFDGKVYLLAGSQPNTTTDDNFFVYDLLGDTINGTPWSSLAKIPCGPIVKGPTGNKPWKDGSSIVVCGDTIYALKGGHKNQFYAYDIGVNTWAIKETMPWPDTIFGKPKKKVYVKDGGATTSDDNVIYAIKGGSTDAFWKYEPGTPGVWTRLESIPYIVSKKYSPKTGAALTYAEGKVWLLKGNKIPEFWTYIPTSAKLNKVYSSSVTSVMVENLTALKFAFNVIPNPVTRLATIKYTVPISGKASLRLYNSTGRLIQTFVNEYRNAGSYSLEIRNWELGISNGVYFLKYEDRTNKSEIKLIVQ